jgi:alanine dehydrogenase
MLVLSRTDVVSLLDLDRLVDAVAAAMVDLSAGQPSMPQRVAASVGHRNALLAAMPAFLPSTGALTTKLVSLFPDNTDRPTHQAIICCFDPDDGTPVALMDGSYVTAVRTAGRDHAKASALAGVLGDQLPIAVDAAPSIGGRRALGRHRLLGDARQPTRCSPRVAEVGSSRQLGRLQHVRRW